MHVNFKEVFEISHKIMDNKEIHSRIQKSYNIVLNGKRRDVLIGRDFALKVNVNIGISDSNELSNEIKKLKCLCELSFSPDTIMDHTIVKFEKPFWKIILEEFDGPVGALPHYLSFNENKGIDEVFFLEQLEEMAESGISFMTLHPTSRLEFYKIAKKTRTIPTTSRGGGILLRDMFINQRKVNIIEKNYEMILNIFKKNDVAISIGSTFRPANIMEALDKVHIEETKLQKYFINTAQDSGVKVLMEGIGHGSLDKVSGYFKLIEPYNVPFMPLGPIPTDSAIGFDHVAAAIGSCWAGMSGVASIVNSVTREEHTGGVPTMESIIEGLKASKVAAHIVNLTKFDKLKEIDNMVATQRRIKRTCVISGGLFDESQFNSEPVGGCLRCNRECPLMKFKGSEND